MYRIPIQQGNVITVEMLEELELGMNKRKVRFILGTPLVIDAFHQDRWDYFYSYKPSSGDRVQQHASLFFEGDRLARIDADIDSQIDFHTVTETSENVLIVPPKKKRGFFAALTPDFLKRGAEEEESATPLDAGLRDPQPGSRVSDETGGSGEVLDAALTAPSIVEPRIDDGTVPDEIYAPNASTETESQSRYLEQLFDDFGTAATPAATPAESVVFQPAVPESREIEQTPRD